ncbi:hypothetical protein AMTR_s00041p00076990 [Amborella trichopoda]|uniref:Uncharacterized protein n=1 Tax=Amborella trichopoda TaxID=13333 RepID=W1PYW8_AMBTC|nr:hypothetical protein AMTR_s00041p00076990 [Amborella trichopoda]
MNAPGTTVATHAQSGLPPQTCHHLNPSGQQPRLGLTNGLASKLLSSMAKRQQIRLSCLWLSLDH